MIDLILPGCMYSVAARVNVIGFKDIDQILIGNVPGVALLGDVGQNDLPGSGADYIGQDLGRLFIAQVT